MSSPPSASAGLVGGQRLDVGFGESAVEEASTALSPLQSYYYFCELCYFFNKK